MRESRRNGDGRARMWLTWSRTLQFFLREGIQPLIRMIGSEHGSGRGGARSVVDNANAWLLNNKRLDRRHDRSAGIIQSLLTTTCIFDITNRLTDL